MQVTVYTTPNCPACVITKRALSKAGIEYDEFDARDHVDFLKGIGHATAPVVIAGEENWSGFRPDKIKGIQNV